MVVFAPTQTFLRYSGGCWSCSVMSITQQTTETSQPVWNRRIDNSTQDSSHRRLSRKNEKSSSQNSDDHVNNPFEKTELSVTKAGTGKNIPGCTCLLSAVNYNLLAYFLLANIFTGAVNLSFETINVSPFTAFVIMNIYLLTLHAAVTVFYNRNILLKL